MIRKKADLHPPLPEGEETGLCTDGLDVCPREIVLKLKTNFIRFQMSHVKQAVEIILTKGVN
jgi:hypothetical protein